MWEAFNGLIPGNYEKSDARKWASQVALVVKNPPANAGDLGSFLGLGRSPGEGHSNPLQYSCLENPMDRGALWAIVHGVAKSWKRPKGLNTPEGRHESQVF